MREIKFRAWDKENEAMVYPKGILFDGRIVNFNCGMLESYDGYELMQYTGLKDKNGKEIYEGDIVKGRRSSHWHDGYDIVRGKIYFSNNSLAFSVDGFGSGLIHDVENIEVIGNIYENPELLEVEK